MTRPDPSDPLDGVRPGARRSYWLREALEAEPPELSADVVAPPLSANATADFAILGGGYTGLWTALRLTELAPGARIVVVEQDICGGGPSGRNGGFVTGWWDELPSLIKRFGDEEAVRTAHAVDAAVDEIGTWSAANGVDAWYTPAGFLSVSAAPSQDGAWRDAAEACARLGFADRWRAVAADEVAARVRSPVFREGAFMPRAATVQPAALARGFRRVALERGVVIHERTRVVSLEGGGGQVSAVVATSSAEGPGLIVAGQVVVALNAWAAAMPEFGRRLVTWSSYMVLTEPIPGSARRDRLDRRRGHRRFALHAPLRADDARRPDRARRRGREGRLRRSDRAGVHA